MAKHEKRCTANPDRECGFCILDEGREDETVPLKDLIAILPAPSEWKLIFEPEAGEFTSAEYRDKYQADVEKSVDKLRDAAQHCPGCMLAALRQSGHSKHIDPDMFDFKKEAKAWLREWNDSNIDGGMR